jgi:hypothetical protein
MAHFRGIVQGGRGATSRLGHASSGLTTQACSWSGKVVTNLYVRHGVDWAEVRLEPHNGAGQRLVIYDGPVAGRDQEGL